MFFEVVQWSLLNELFQQLVSKINYKIMLVSYIHLLIECASN